jgi:hypothetical protein
MEYALCWRDRVSIVLFPLEEKKKKTQKLLLTGIFSLPSPPLPPPNPVAPPAQASKLAPVLPPRLPLPILPFPVLPPHLPSTSCPFTPYPKPLPTVTSKRELCHQDIENLPFPQFEEEKPHSLFPQVASSRRR